MTLREWCQREGHPYVLGVYVTSSHPISPTLTRAGKRCVCGHRATASGRREVLVLAPSAVDSEGADRT